MDELKRLNVKRGFVRSQITKSYAALKENIGTWIYEVKLSYLSKFQLFQKEIKELDGQVEQLLYQKTDLKDEDMQAEFEKVYEYSSKIAEGILFLEQSLKSASIVQPSRSNNNTTHDPADMHSKLKRPTVPLPVFNSTEDESLETFLLNFEATTEKYAYSSYDKMLLLKQQVRGKGELLLNSLEVSEQNFESAKELLMKAFASPLTQKYKVMSQLVDLKLTYDSEPFEYISKIRNLCEAFKNLKINTDHVLQYFIWEGFNDTFKSQLIQITNNSKPTLDEIKEHFFEASERYSGVVKKFKDKKKFTHSEPKKDYSVRPKTVSLAADVKFEDPKPETISNAFKLCSMCRDLGESADHPIHKCTKFSTPKAKIERLTKVGACTRCGNSTHSTNDCRFRFTKKCVKCRSWHFSFLCGQDEIAVQPTKKFEPKNNERKFKDKNNYHKETSTSSVWVELKSSFSCNKAILPTITGMIGNNMIRCLKDTGCQANFIAEEIVKKNNLNIVKKDISLTVNGFNVAKDYQCCLVEVPMRLGDNIVMFDAICVPSLNIKLNIPGLTALVKRFSDLGFEMADKSLKESKIADVELIIGTDSLHILEEKVISFGNPIPSLYYSTPFGVMLVGNIDRIFSNLKYLDNPASNYSTILSNTIGLDWKAEHCNIAKIAPLNELDELLVDVNTTVVDEGSALLESEIEKATAQILNDQCDLILNIDSGTTVEDVFSEQNVDLVNFALTSATREQDGRLTLPLLWNGKVCHLLGKNFNLSKQILLGNHKKLSKNHDQLLMVDEVFRSQEKLGVIEKIENLPKFLEENPNHSFLPHMPVFKLDRDTTKTRVVYLSNLCEKDKNQPMTVSHNQAIFSGPCLNSKISTALLLLRFDKFMLIFDLVKAFLTISLDEIDQNRLMFLWFQNVSQNNLEIVGYRSKQLPFGLRCSPTLLMLALYKILIVDAKEDPSDLKDLKRDIYHKFYMDNGAISAANAQELKLAFENLNKIFNSYGFKLQQFATNELELQDAIDQNQEQKTETKVKLFGLLWDRETDELSTKPLHLNKDANTKREILRSIASNFDVFGFSGPILNRARLFLHDLQCQKGLNWDFRLSDEQLRDWHNIAHQVNNSPQISIKRFVGEQGQKYRLIAFTDSSQQIYGTVIYIQNVETLEVSFVLSKNKVVGRTLKGKSIPSLEFNAIVLGTQVLIELYSELCGPTTVKPVDIVELHLYSDSLVSLHWLNAFSNKLDKMTKRSVFVMNRLNTINKLCETFPVRFSFISGILNPADFVTRSISYKILIKSNYFSGPDFLTGHGSNNVSEDGICDVTIPNPSIEIKTSINEISCNQATGDETDSEVFMVDLISKFSSFSRLCGVLRNVYKFINHLKNRIGKIDLAQLDSDDETSSQKATRLLIHGDQKIHFSEIFHYFSKDDPRIKAIPNLVNQLKVFPDTSGILRVKSKFEGKEKQIDKFPILLAKNSSLTKLIITDIHNRMSHAGVYSVLAEIRKEFYIPHIFSVVKKELRNCVNCKRFNNKTVKLNQSSYRDFRIDPPQIPFRSIFIDHLGPYWVKINDKKQKVWILLITCLFTRGINLKICWDLSVKSFLQAFQLHVFDFGIPSICLSDAGSQIVAGGRVILDFLKDVESKKFLETHSIKSIEFQHYFTGHHELGALVEVCVKMTKRLIFGTLRNNIFSFDQFEFLVSQTIHLVNKRPIAFKESLRDGEVDYLDPITPEILIRGFEIPSLNIIPKLQPIPDDDFDWNKNEDHTKLIKQEYGKLIEARKRLYKIYYGEFLSTLISQATDRKDRYRPVNHEKLGPGDIVLLKEPLCKPSSYPMAIVKDVNINSLGEVTGVTVFKGKTRESVKRHVSSVIPLLKDSLLKPDIDLNIADRLDNSDDPPRRYARKAATKCRNLLKNLGEED